MMIVDRRAFDRNRRLLVARQVRHWRLVQPSSGVDVHGINDIVRRF